MRGRGLAALLPVPGLGLTGVARSAASYVEAPVPDGDVMAGSVRLAGAPPNGEPLTVRKNTAVGGEPKPSQALMVGSTGGVRGTVVALEGVARGRRPPDFELDYDRLTVFNIALPTKNQVVDVSQRIKTPGVIEVVCDAQTHVRAWIVVRETPCFAVTNDNGQFRIDEIPPGRHRVTAWHESWVATVKDRTAAPSTTRPASAPGR